MPGYEGLHSRRHGLFSSSKSGDSTDSRLFNLIISDFLSSICTDLATYGLTPDLHKADLDITMATPAIFLDFEAHDPGKALAQESLNFK